MISSQGIRRDNQMRSILPMVMVVVVVVQVDVGLGLSEYRAST